jgi:uncharacterized protein YprB with RNaseH-like and TPR domain
VDALLEHTFIHIQGIGKKTEQRLWERGILKWNHFLEYGETIFSPARDQAVRQELDASIGHRKDVRFFCERLSLVDMWRIFKAFKDGGVYLDIETSGGYQGLDEITVIGLYDGNAVQSFVNGINLDEFEVSIAKYDLMITFNGACFDLPFIRRWFPNISLPPAHIDLRFLLKRLGYQGGLKEIEKILGIVRDPEINGLDGYDAVMLWKTYQWGEQSALDRLIQYNTADIVNLKPLMEIAYEKIKAETLSFVTF